jgi:hypothetical protein
MIIGLVITLGIVGAVFYFMRDITTVSLDATGTVVGKDFTIDADQCTTGERSTVEMARGRALPLGGVKITGRNGGSVFVDREGQHVVIRPPACSAKACEIPLDESRCSTFLVELDWTGNTYNNHDIWAGRLRLECKLDDGGIDATLVFPGCA